MVFGGDQDGRRRKGTILIVAWLSLWAQSWTWPAVAQESSAPFDLPEVRNAKVLFTSDPSGRPVIVDGVPLESPTPTEIELRPGQYTVEVTAPGYEPLQYTLAIDGGEKLVLRFVLKSFPPKRPSPSELRALVADGSETEHEDRYPGGVDEKTWTEVRSANAVCQPCHTEVPGLLAEGTHGALRCSECHGDADDHVREDWVVGPADVPRGGAIHSICMRCHDSEKGKTKFPSVKTISYPAHIENKKVSTRHGCQQCHMVHAPLKWVHEAREIVGLPEKMQTLPLLNEDMAIETRGRFDALTETSVVFPLTPGLIGLTAFRDVPEYPAKEFMIGGVIVALGSYWFGNYLHDKKVRELREINARREAANLRAKQHNEAVDRAMADYYLEWLAWQEESEKRGVVTVRVR